MFLASLCEGGGPAGPEGENLATNRNISVCRKVLSPTACGRSPLAEGAKFRNTSQQKGPSIMAEQSFWDMLRTKRDSLTKSGIIVADYLMQHAEDAQYLSISSLAKACGVAEATIFRFCRALGFDGYNEMKIALAKATATAMPVSLKLEPGVDTQTL